MLTYVSMPLGCGRPAQRKKTMTAAPSIRQNMRMGTPNALYARSPTQAQTKLEMQPDESTAATNSNMHMQHVLAWHAS